MLLFVFLVAEGQCLRSGSCPGTRFLSVPSTLGQTATSWHSDTEPFGRKGTNMAHKTTKGSFRSGQTYRRFLQEIALLATAALVLQCCVGRVNAEGRLLQKANTFTDKFVKAFKGSYCINLASGTVHVGTNIQVYDCHNGEENFFSYTEAGEIRPKKAASMCLEVSPDADSKHNVYLATCNANSDNQKWDFLSNGLVMSRQKFSDQPKGTCMQVEKKGAASNVDGGNCDSTSIFQQFSVDGFQPTASMPKADAAPPASSPAPVKAPAPAPAPVPTKKAAPPPPKPKAESNIDFQQRLKDREGFHKLKTANGCFCKVSWEVGSSLFEYPDNCGDPDSLRGYSWCLTEEKPACKGVDGHHHWDRCTPIAKKPVAGTTKTAGNCGK